MHILLTAISPICHGDTLTGMNNGSNIRLAMRTPCVVNGMVTRIPCLSANSLRSLFFRKTLADHLIETLEIEPKTLSKLTYGMLYNGGNMIKGGKASYTNEISAKVREKFPIFALLGGCANSFIMQESDLKMTCLPVASEFTESLAKIGAPADIIEKSKEKSAFSFTEYSDIRICDEYVRDNDHREENHPMPFEFEVFAAGTQFYIEIFIDKFSTDLTKSALAFAIESFNGYVGGQSARGYGRVSIEHDIKYDSSLYLEFIEKNRDELKENLVNSVFCSGKVIGDVI